MSARAARHDGSRPLTPQRLAVLRQILAEPKTPKTVAAELSGSGAHPRAVYSQLRELVLAGLARAAGGVYSVTDKGRGIVCAAAKGGESWR